MTDSNCAYGDCSNEPCNDPVSMFCPNHIKVMRPYDSHVKETQ